MDSAWLFKGPGPSPLALARTTNFEAHELNDYRFVAPLDQQFLRKLIALTRAERFAYVSASYSSSFATYLTVHAEHGLRLAVETQQPLSGNSRPGPGRPPDKHHRPHLRNAHTLSSPRPGQLQLRLHSHRAVRRNRATRDTGSMWLLRFDLSSQGCKWVASRGFRTRKPASPKDSAQVPVGAPGDQRMRRSMPASTATHCAQVRLLRTQAMRGGRAEGPRHGPRRRRRTYKAQRAIHSARVATPDPPTPQPSRLGIASFASSAPNHSCCRQSLVRCASLRRWFARRLDPRP